MLTSCLSPDTRVGSAEEIEVARQGISAAAQSATYDYFGAKHDLTLQCIRDAGHDVTWEAFDPDAVSDDQVGRLGIDRWFETTTEGVEAEVAATVEKLRADLSDEGVSGSSGVQMSDEAGKLYYGDPTEYADVELPDGTVVGAAVSGCVGAAEAELYGVDAREAVTVKIKFHQGGGTYNSLRDSRAIQRVSKEFTKCMDKKGFTMVIPTDLPEEFGDTMLKVARGHAQMSAFKEPIDKFVAADAECKAEHETTAKFAAAYVDASAEYRDERERVVAAYQEMLQHADKVIEERFVNNS